MKLKLIDILNRAKEIIVYKNGEKLDINTEDLKVRLRKVTNHSYYMPGMAIAKDSVIKKEKNKGYWIEFKYIEKTTFAEYDFDSLLIRVQDELDGFNMIRGNDGVYEGKTYYLQLATFSNELYKYLVDAKK